LTPEEREQLQEVATILRKILRHKQRRVDRAFDIAIAVAAAIVALLAIIAGMWILLISVAYIAGDEFLPDASNAKKPTAGGVDIGMESCNKHVNPGGGAVAANARNENGSDASSER
jgi:hypothetical protein